MFLNGFPGHLFIFGSNKIIRPLCTTEKNTSTHEKHTPTVAVLLYTSAPLASKLWKCIDYAALADFPNLLLTFRTMSLN